MIAGPSAIVSPWVPRGCGFDLDPAVFKVVFIFAEKEANR
jgi:hypothetical protein